MVLTSSINKSPYSKKMEISQETPRSWASVTLIFFAVIGTFGVLSLLAILQKPDLLVEGSLLKTVNHYVHILASQLHMNPCFFSVYVFTGGSSGFLASLVWWISAPSSKSGGCQNKIRKKEKSKPLPLEKMVRLSSATLPQEAPASSVETPSSSVAASDEKAPPPLGLPDSDHDFMWRSPFPSLHPSPSMDLFPPMEFPIPSPFTPDLMTLEHKFSRLVSSFRRKATVYPSTPRSSPRQGPLPQYSASYSTITIYHPRTHQVPIPKSFSGIPSPMQDLIFRLLIAQEVAYFYSCRAKKHRIKGLLTDESEVSKKAD